MELFNKDGTLNQKTVDGADPAQLDAAFTKAVAEYDQQIEARRAGEPNDINTAGTKVDHLRTLIRTRAVQAGQRSPGVGATVKDNT